MEQNDKERSDAQPGGGPATRQPDGDPAPPGQDPGRARPADDQQQPDQDQRQGGYGGSTGGEDLVR